MMTMRVAVQMDPMAQINFAGDSTFALMIEAQARGHQPGVGAVRWSWPGLARGKRRA